MDSLQNKKVLVTRTAEQAQSFADKIMQLGGVPVLLPLIELKAINTDLLTQELASNQFDWIIFTSPQSVRFFFEENSLNQNKAKIAVVGSGTKKALEDKGISVDFIPSQFTAKQLAKEIQLIANSHIFIPRSALAKNDIVEILEERACKVTTLSVYQNTEVKYATKDINKLKLESIDFITFTSGSAVESYIVNGLTPYTAKTICIGPETAKVAEKLSVKVDAIASPHTIDGVIEEIKKSLTS